MWKPTLGFYTIVMIGYCKTINSKNVALMSLLQLSPMWTCRTYHIRPKQKITDMYAKLKMKPHN